MARGNGADARAPWWLVVGLRGGHDGVVPLVWSRPELEERRMGRGKPERRLSACTPGDSAAAVGAQLVRDSRLLGAEGLEARLGRAGGRLVLVAEGSDEPPRIAR